MTTQDDVRTTVAAGVAGDADACDRLFGRCADRLLLYIRLRIGRGLRSRVDSMDVLQEAFLHAHRDIRSFQCPAEGDPEKAFMRWLCRIAENRIRDLAERHDADRRDHRREARDVTEVLRQLQRSGHGPATSLVRQEERERLVEAIDGLDDTDRQIVMLRHFEGLTLDAIAERTDLSPSSVRRSVGRATLRLGERLAPPPHSPAPSPGQGSDQ